MAIPDASSPRAPEMSHLDHHHYSPNNLHRGTSINSLPLGPEPYLAINHTTLPYSYSNSKQYQSNNTSQLSPGVTASLRSHHDSVISNPHSPTSIESISNKAGRRRGSMTGSEYDHISQEPQLPQRPSAVALPPRDSEKRVLSPSGPPSDSRSRVYAPDPEAGIQVYDESEEADLERKALRILIYLSTFCPFISLLILFWTLISLLLTLLLLPLRAILSTKLPGLRSFLLPPLKLQLGLIYSPCLQLQQHPSNSNSNSSSSPKPRNGFMLAMIHLGSPLLAPIFMLASWTAAFFWFFSLVLGDPAGKDGHNDGRSAVIGVRSWWEAWLLRGVR